MIGLRQKIVIFVTFAKLLRGDIHKTLCGTMLLGGGEKSKSRTAAHRTATNQSPGERSISPSMVRFSIYKSI